MGAKVIAAASSEEKVALCKKHGADEGVVYGRGPFDRDGQKGLAQLFKDAVGPNGADVIYDAVGGDYAEPALRSIAWEGKYLVVGFAAGDIPKIPLNLALLKGCDIVGVFWGAWVGKNPKKHQASVAELLKMYDEGKIKPFVSERFPLEKAADAITHLASRKAMGKVVVTVG
jgi:NADPH2:quinone reductase